MSIDGEAVSVVCPSCFQRPQMPLLGRRQQGENHAQVLSTFHVILIESYKNLSAIVVSKVTPMRCMIGSNHGRRQLDLTEAEVYDMGLQVESAMGS